MAVVCSQAYRNSIYMVPSEIVFMGFQVKKVNLFLVEQSANEKKKSATLTCKLICSCPKWRYLRRNYIFLPASTLVGTFLRRKGLLCRRRRPKSGWYDTHGNDDRYHCPGKILVNVNASPSVGRNGFPLILKPPSSHRMLLKWEATA